MAREEGEEAEDREEGEEVEDREKGELLRIGGLIEKALKNLRIGNYKVLVNKSKFAKDEVKNELEKDVSEESVNLDPKGDNFWPEPCSNWGNDYIPCGEDDDVEFNFQKFNGRLGKTYGSLHKALAEGGDSDSSSPCHIEAANLLKGAREGKLVLETLDTLSPKVILLQTLE
ncbi:hypothetical protein TanjilG_01675 [Lupinus angustifolius]|nr:hypothetical protein TanjilG_01675 [Lupinus angustifolius]